MLPRTQRALMEAGVLLRGRAKGPVEGNAGRLRGRSAVEASVAARAAQQQG